MKTYKSTQLQHIFDVSSETIRLWANEFQGYLSPTANPGTGRHRLFTDDDLSVFVLVASMKREGKTFDDIHISLKSGQLGNLDEYLSGRGNAIEGTSQLAIAQHQIRELITERDEAKALARDLQRRLIELETELRIYKDQTGKVAELNQEIGKLKALLEMAQTKE